MTLRTRFILIFSTLVALGFYFLIGHLLDDMRQRYVEAVEETLVDQANILASLLEVEIKQGPIPGEKFHQAFRRVDARSFESQIYQMKKTEVDQRVYVTDAKGVVLFDSDAGKAEGQDYSQWRDVYLTLRGKYGARSSRLNEADPSSSVIYVAAPLRQDEKIVGSLTVSKPTRSINLFIQTARYQVIFAGTTAAVLIIILGMALSIWVTRPIKKMTQYARAIRDGQSTVLPKLSGGEIAEMGHAFEEMRQALAGKKYVELYTQNLTHELKSPLTAIQGAAELLQEELGQDQREQFLNNIQHETKRMQMIVDRMLKLSSLQAQEKLGEIEAVPLNELVEHVLKRMKSKLEAKIIYVHTSFSRSFLVNGERFLIEQAIQNILDNAIDFSPLKGEIRISIVAQKEKWILSIQDQGPGIPEFAVDRVMERFYSLPRPDSQQKSSGLGLSIVQEIMRLHHGRVELQNVKNGGCLSKIIFPMKASERI